MQHRIARKDLVKVSMKHKGNSEALAISVALILAATTAFVSTPVAQRTIQTFEVPAFLVGIDEIGLGMATEDLPLAQDTD